MLDPAVGATECDRADCRHSCHGCDGRRHDTLGSTLPGDGPGAGCCSDMVLSGCRMAIRVNHETRAVGAVCDRHRFFCRPLDSPLPRCPRCHLVWDRTFPIRSSIRPGLGSQILHPRAPALVEVAVVQFASHRHRLELRSGILLRACLVSAKKEGGANPSAHSAQRDGRANCGWPRQARISIRVGWLAARPPHSALARRQGQAKNLGGLRMCEECVSKRKRLSRLSLSLWLVGLTMFMVALARWAS